MTREVLFVICLVSLLAGTRALGNEAPSVEDRYFATQRGQAVEFVLSAEDPDIDPYAAESQILRFILLDEPSHGVLVGDLNAVVYAWPHSATVRMKYIPDEDFVGRDRILYSVVDPLGASPLRAATYEFDVLDARVEGRVAGAWDAEFAFNVESVGVEAFGQRLVEVYRIGRLTARGIAEFAMDSSSGVKTVLVSALRLETDLELGGFDLETTVALDPRGRPTTAFEYLLTDATVQLLGLSLTHSLFLTAPRVHSYQVLSVRGSAGGLGFSNAVRLGLAGDCGFCFSRNDALLSWEWCGVQFRAASGFTSEGLESLVVGISAIPLAFRGGLPSGITMDVAFTFGLSTQSLDLGLDWKPLRRACLRVLGEFSVADAAEATIEAVGLYALVLECEAVPGVRLKSATSFDRLKNPDVTGQIDYFESVSLVGELAACCGIPGSWSVVTYFDHGSGGLFDWGMTLLKADIGISEHFGLRLEAAIRSGELGDPVSELAVGWTARW